MRLQLYMRFQGNLAHTHLCLQEHHQSNQPEGLRRARLPTSQSGMHATSYDLCCRHRGAHKLAHAWSKQSFGGIS